MNVLVKLKKLLRTRSLLVAVLFLVVVGVFWFIRYKSSKNGKVVYQTARVERGTVVSSISASGSIISSNFISIDTTASGVVKEVFVKEGQKVYKGQRIARIELDMEGEQRLASAYSSLISADNALASANNNLRQAQASLEKVYDEIKGHDSDETFAMKETRTKAEVAKDNAYNSLRSAQANLSVASYNYRLASPDILAPVSGVVGSINIVPGMILGSASGQSGSSSTRVGVIKFEGLPVASFNVSEVDISKVKEGQKATITIDSIADKTFTGKVVAVDRVGISSSGVTNYPVLVQFDNSVPEILPNMSASVNIILDTKADVLVIPNSALVTAGDGSTSVRVLKNGKEETVSVVVGISSDTNTEIVSGLSEGDIVVTGTVSSSSTQGGANRSVSPFSSFGGGGFRMR